MTQYGITTILFSIGIQTKLTMAEILDIYYFSALCINHDGVYL